MSEPSDPINFRESNPRGSDRICMYTYICKMNAKLSNDVFCPEFLRIQNF